MNGSALLARVRAAYLHVPAVETVTSFNGRTFQSYTYLLGHGRITDELNHGPYSGELVVAHGDGSAYDFNSVTRCWSPDPNFWAVGGERGSRFPHLAIPYYSTQVQAARLVRRVWQLPVTETDDHGKDFTNTLVIGANTFLVEREVLGNPGSHNIVRYKNLAQAPRFPTPRPLCRSKR